MKSVVILVALVLGACAERDRGDQGSVTQLKEPSDAIDQQLVVALAQAKNFHHEAKVYMADGNLAQAIASVRRILVLAFPPNASEAEDVRDDARALLAKLLVNQGQLDEAARVVDEGLAASRRESFFVANLYTVQGEIHEARAVLLDADEAAKPKAIEERRAAIASYDRSIQINERLQKSLVEER